MNFTDKDLKQSLGYSSDITVFLNTGSCPDELVPELQERQLELINKWLAVQPCYLIKKEITNGISNPVVRLLE